MALSTHAEDSKPVTIFSGDAAASGLLLDISKYNRQFGSPIKRPVVVISGIQSAGKTSWLEAMIGFPAGYKSRGISTRRPREFILCHDASLTEPTVTFDGKKIHWKHLPHENAEVDKQLEEKDDFCSELLTIVIESPDVSDCDFIDLIGLRPNPSGEKAENDAKKIEQIAANYIRDPQAVNVAILKCTEDASTVTDIAFLEKLATCDGPGFPANRRDDFAKSTLFIVNRINEKLGFKDTEDANAFFKSFLQRKQYHFISLVPGLSMTDPDDTGSDSFDQRCAFLKGLVAEECKLYESTKSTLHQKDQHKSKSTQWSKSNDSILGIPGAVKKVQQRLIHKLVQELPKLKKKVEGRLGECNSRLAELQAYSLFQPDKWNELHLMLVEYTVDFLRTVQNFQRGSVVKSSTGKDLTSFQEVDPTPFRPSACGLTFLEELSDAQIDINHHPKLENLLTKAALTEDLFDCSKALKSYGSCMRAHQMLKWELLEHASKIDTISEEDIMNMAHDPNCRAEDVFPADKVVLDCACSCVQLAMESLQEWFAPFLVKCFTRDLQHVHDFLFADHPVVKIIPGFSQYLTHVYKTRITEQVSNISKHFLYTMECICESRQQGGFLTGILTVPGTLPNVNQHLTLHGSKKSTPLLTELCTVLNKYPNLDSADVVQDVVYRVMPQTHASKDFKLLRHCAKLQYANMVNYLMPILQGLLRKELTSFVASTSGSPEPRIEKVMHKASMSLSWEDVQKWLSVDVEEVKSQEVETLAEIESLKGLLTKMMSMTAFDSCSY